MSAFQMPEAVAEKLADAYLHRRTNADRIRSMSDEELDEFLNEVQGDAYLVGFHARAESRFTPYGKRWLDWLKEEADDGNHDH